MFKKHRVIRVIRVQKSIRVKETSSFPVFQGTNSGRCTIYVQYLYNICTFTIVQVLYNYCTYIVQRPVLVWRFRRGGGGVGAGRPLRGGFLKNANRQKFFLPVSKKYVYLGSFSHNGLWLLPKVYLIENYI